MRFRYIHPPAVGDRRVHQRANKHFIYKVTGRETGSPRDLASASLPTKGTVNIILRITSVIGKCRANLRDNVTAKFVKIYRIASMRKIRPAAPPRSSVRARPLAQGERIRKLWSSVWAESRDGKRQRERGREERGRGEMPQATVSFTPRRHGDCIKNRVHISLNISQIVNNRIVIADCRF